MVKVLSLFSGTHSIGKVCKQRGWYEVSLDKDLGSSCALGSDYKSQHHIQEDIFKWDYKMFPTGYFDIITASPVCLWWSALRRTWIGRKLKHMNRPLTAQDIDNDIDTYGKPMVDKVREIIDYFKPKFYWIENPKTGRMKEYITDLPYYDVDYCKYSKWGYKKTTRFWTNIKKFIPKKCKKDCENIVKYKNQCHHKTNLCTNNRKIIDGKMININTKKLRQKYKHRSDVSQKGGSSNRYERYRIPEKLINDLFDSTEL